MNEKDRKEKDDREYRLCACGKVLGVDRTNRRWHVGWLCTLIAYRREGVAGVVEQITKAGSYESVVLAKFLFLYSTTSAHRARSTAALALVV